MKQPLAFREFAIHCLLIDNEDTGDQDAIDAVVRKAYRRLTIAQQREVKSYLEHLLTGGYSDRDLWDIWKASGAGIAFFPSPRGFFERMPEVIAG